MATITASTIITGIIVTRMNITNITTANTLRPGILTIAINTAMGIHSMGMIITTITTMPLPGAMRTLPSPKSSPDREGGQEGCQRSLP
jgi:hypothetical protein